MLKNLYLLVGPSGSGKTTITEGLKKQYGYKPLKSYTTRPKRFNTETGHIFVTPEEFKQLGTMIAYTVFDGHEYGATQELVDNCDLYIIDPAGIAFFAGAYNNDKRPYKIIGITEHPNELKKRMAKRGDSDEAINRRLETDTHIFNSLSSICDLVIRNENKQNTIDIIAQYINIQERKNDL